MSRENAPVKPLPRQFLEVARRQEQPGLSIFGLNLLERRQDTRVRHGAIGVSVKIARAVATGAGARALRIEAAPHIDWRHRLRRAQRFDVTVGKQKIAGAQMAGKQNRVAAAIQHIAVATIHRAQHSQRRLPQVAVGIVFGEVALANHHARRNLVNRSESAPASRRSVQENVLVARVRGRNRRVSARRRIENWGTESPPEWR